jgi:hypothetical protein
LFVGNPKWKSLVDGKEYTITFLIGSDEWEDDESIASNDGTGTPSLHSAFTKDFGPDFMVADGMTIKNGDKVLDRLSLKGTYKALLAATRCASRQYKNGNVDPFAE